MAQTFIRGATKPTPSPMERARRSTSYIFSGGYVQPKPEDRPAVDVPTKVIQAQVEVLKAEKEARKVEARRIEEESIKGDAVPTYITEREDLFTPLQSQMALKGAKDIYLGKTRSEIAYGDIPLKERISLATKKGLPISERFTIIFPKAIGSFKETPKPKPSLIQERVLSKEALKALTGEGLEAPRISPKEKLIKEIKELPAEEFYTEKGLPYRKRLTETDIPLGEQVLKVGTTGTLIAGTFIAPQLTGVAIGALGQKQVIEEFGKAQSLTRLKAEDPTKFMEGKITYGDYGNGAILKAYGRMFLAGAISAGGYYTGLRSAGMGVTKAQIEAVTKPVPKYTGTIQQLGKGRFRIDAKYFKGTPSAELKQRIVTTGKLTGKRFRIESGEIGTRLKYQDFWTGKIYKAYAKQNIMGGGVLEPTGTYGWTPSKQAIQLKETMRVTKVGKKIIPQQFETYKPQLTKGYAYTKEGIELPIRYATKGVKIDYGKISIPGETFTYSTAYKLKIPTKPLYYRFRKVGKIYMPEQIGALKSKIILRIIKKQQDFGFSGAGTKYIQKTKFGGSINQFVQKLQEGLPAPSKIFPTTIKKTILAPFPKLTPGIKYKVIQTTKTKAKQKQIQKQQLKLVTFPALRSEQIIKPIAKQKQMVFSSTDQATKQMSKQMQRGGFGMTTTIPTFAMPSFTPGGFGGFIPFNMGMRKPQKKIRKVKVRRITAYTPSFKAIFWKIRGTKPTKKKVAPEYSFRPIPYSWESLADIFRKRVIKKKVKRKKK